MIIEWLIGGLLFGFLGSVHCVGMCGPIALALPVSAVQGLKKYAGIFLYNLGRTVVYVLLGSVVGFFGKLAGLVGFQKYLSVLTGVLIIASVVIPKVRNKLNSWQAIPSNRMGVITKPFKKFMKMNSISALFAVGLLNGLLPCGFVYMAIAAALNTGSTVSSMIFMAGFGFGTMPAMIAVAISPGFLSLEVRRRIQKFLPWATLALGLILIFRGL
ncbi:MAG: sulfite exporter TauE/SafE family protein [Balneolaceae bacterium]|nr:sulfite exporter TauE/SafE family protein [Balneolaceae bacterium]